MLIEDEELLRATLSAFLERDADLVVCAAVASGEEALPLIEEREPDLVVVDASLPGMTGVEVIRRVRSAPPSPPCLMFSGRSGSTLVQDARDAGAVGYVIKGDPARVRDAVHSVLGGDAYVSDPIRDHWLA